MSEDSKWQKPMTQGQFHMLHAFLQKMRGENETSHNELKEDIRILKNNTKVLGAHHGYSADQEGRLTKLS